MVYENNTLFSVQRILRSEIKGGRAMDEIAFFLSRAKVPPFYAVDYKLCRDEIFDIEQSVRETLKREGTLSRIKKGSTVAITAGSREIHYIDKILLAIINELKAVGAHPFIFPAMGSHGGAIAEGQKAIIEGYGITEKTMGVPIISSMDTVVVGDTPEGLCVHADKAAFEADYIIPVGRIKPHPEFKGKHESGILKMMAIGIGKQHGANMCHQLGMENMPKNILAFSKVLLEKCSMPFGVGIVENALHGTYSITAIPSENIIEEEAELLETAKGLVPVVPFERVDVIICEEMGKDISGTGMDSNVIGKSISLGVSKPFAERIGVFDLTEKSHGNFNGVALADTISKRLFDKISFEETYPNTITACEPLAVKIPSVMPSDKLCLQFCIQTCLKADRDNTRIVWIKNTLSLGEFYISEALLKEAEDNPLIATNRVRYYPAFDDKDTFISFKSIEEGE